MWSLMESLINSFQWSDNTWWFQFFGVSAIIYFFGKSLVKIYFALKDTEHEIGVFPALGIVYMVLSVSFVLFMVGSFDDIVGIFTKSFECLYKLPFSTTGSCIDSEANAIYLNPTNKKDLARFMQPIPTTLLWILLAFSINFSKSFFTLNTLELGLLPVGYKQSEKLKEILNKNFLIAFEYGIRLLVGFAFIAIEKEFSEIGKKFSNNKDAADVNVVTSVFNHLAVEMIILYILVFLWSLPFLILLKNNWWKISSILQVLVGIFLAYYYYSISALYRVDFDDWKFWFLDNSRTMIIISIALISVIVLIEIIWWIQLIKEPIKSTYNKIIGRIRSSDKSNGTSAA